MALVHIVLVGDYQTSARNISGKKLFCGIITKWIQTSQKMIFLLLEIGFQHRGFCWYLGDPGSTCDATCSRFGFTNEALAAANVIQQDDCTIIEHFNTVQGLGISGDGATAAWGFGYMYTNGKVRYCTNFSSISIGTRIGEANSSPIRRLVCACEGS